MIKSLSDLEFFPSEKKLGTGAFSSVIKARIKKTNKIIALKTVP